MTFKKCRNEGCEVLIEVRKTDQGWRPYEESGNLHNCQYSEYAKAHRQEKNDHGNENSEKKLYLNQETGETKLLTQTEAAAKNENYVDHTLAGIPQIITIVGESAEEMDDLANSWLKKEAGKIRFKGGQRAYRSHDDKHEITLYYEEIAKQ